jgi:PAS domain S-box-containing protein
VPAAGSTRPVSGARTDVSIGASAATAEHASAERARRADLASALLPVAHFVASTVDSPGGAAGPSMAEHQAPRAEGPDPRCRRPLSLRRRWIHPRSMETDRPREPVDAVLGAEPRLDVTDALGDGTCFAAVLAAAPDGVIVVDRDGKIVLVNAEARALFGYDPGELLHREVEALVPVAMRARHVGHRATYARDPMTRPMGMDLDLAGIRKDGSEFPVDISLSSVEAPNGRLVVAFVRDATERQRLNDESRALERQLLEAERLKSLGLLAGGVAHDFNNLLAVVLGNASLALTELDEGGHPHAELQQIMRATRQAADLTGQMLAYAGKGRYVVEPVLVSALVRDMVDLIASTISKDVALELLLDDDAPTIEADVNQLRQVVLNLITNASDCLRDHPGAITVRTGTVVADRSYLAQYRLADDVPEGPYVFLEVSDTGPGMDDETQARIFDPFFTTKQSGRGLGLAAVLGIVRGHRGAIRLYSAPGLGTSFKLLFPASGQAEVAPPPRTDANDWRGSGTVLVADDEEPIRQMAGRLLGSLGFSVVFAHDGLGVQAMAEARLPFAFVLLDLMMPGMDGAEVLDELERRGATTPIIVCSGYNSQELSQRFARYAFATFLQKPYSLAELRAAAHAVLSRPDASGEPPPSM